MRKGRLATEVSERTPALGIFLGLSDNYHAAMKHPKYSHSFEVTSELPEELHPLKRLAFNLRWTWHEPTQELFRQVDRQLWEEVEHNPVQLLNGLSAKRIQALCNDAAFLASLKVCADDLDQYLEGKTWFGETFPEQVGRTLVAYFCAEFGISETLPIYSGGLGVLAGDHLKAASDLGVPLVGVGLLYSRGYFRQILTSDGWQQEHYPKYDFYQYPLQLMRGEDQQPLRVEVELPDRTIICQVWKCDVGRIQLVLLDSNVLENAPVDQEITDTLYGGDQEMRIRQELILGVGGMRALDTLGIRPTVCHMNEGHSAFLSLERIRQFVKQRGCDFRLARKVVVAGNVFTTHTPVPAGFDLFPPDVLERYASSLAQEIGLKMDDLIRLGRIDPENDGEPFNMAVFAMENSNYVNGVSELHARVTRQMFHARWPDYPEDEVPVSAITNGVHTLSWTSPRMAKLFDTYLGSEWRERPDDPETWAQVHAIPDRELWEVRENMRGDFVRFVRKRVQRDLVRRGHTRSDASQAETILDPRILTIGFARRFATYKRATLLLSDPERLRSLLFHSDRPIQIVIAGKSHPKDDEGKRLIQQIVTFVESESAMQRIVFLEDYDISVAKMMVQGIDLWLNNPRRPMEASGTSGMKVVPNGGLNCSALDGWWDEGFDPGVGWAIGSRNDYADTGFQDWVDSRSLYVALEGEVSNKFYTRSNGDPPTGWVEMIKQSMAKLAPRFSTARMVRDYAEKFYLPASVSFQAMESNGLGRAREALAWRDKVRAAWPKVRVDSVSDTLQSRNLVGSTFSIRVTADLDGLMPEEARVQAVVGRVGSNRELQDVWHVDLTHVGSENGMHSFEGEVPCRQAGHLGYTVRIVPSSPDVVIPSELNLVRWEKD